MATQTNYPKITGSSLVKRFTKIYATCVKSDGTLDFSSQPTKMIWGPPGVGKSQAIVQFGHKLAQKLNKKCNITTASLLLMNPIDLRGIPTKAEDASGKLVARWLTPEIFKMDPSNDIVNMLFLDELPSAPPSVQAATYQIALTRCIGEHKLPDNCIVICAGNRVTDKAVAYKMPKPLGNRMTHFEMMSDVEAWIAWAVAAQVDPRIVGYIKWKPDELSTFDPKNDDVAFQTPRSWETVDRYLKAIPEIDEAFDFIAGSIGTGAAMKFRAYTDVFMKLPNFADIKAGKHKSLPAGVDKEHMDVLYACAAMLSANVIREVNGRSSAELAKEKNFAKELDNVGKFLMLMPKEYATATMREIFSTCRSASTAFTTCKPIMGIIKDLAEVLSEE